MSGRSRPDLLPKIVFEVERSGVEIAPDHGPSWVLFGCSRVYLEPLHRFMTL